MINTSKANHRSSREAPSLNNPERQESEIISMLPWPTTPSAELNYSFKNPQTDPDLTHEDSEREASRAEREESKNFSTAMRMLDYVLDKIAVNPHSVDSAFRMLGRIGLDCIPFLGPIKKLADARALYRTEDPEKQEQGRQLFVIATGEFALDVSTGGLSSLIPDELLTMMRTMKDYQKQSSNPLVKWIPIPDPLSFFAGLILVDDRIRKTADSFLSGNYEELRAVINENGESQND